MKIIVIPDIHGRDFWKNALSKFDNYDCVVFLGDYHDPYPFEGISVNDSLVNFGELLEECVPRKNVTLLLGNHDMPYFDKRFKKHCRYDTRNAHIMRELFDNHRERFMIAHVEDDVLFTHAGVNADWIKSMDSGFIEGDGFSITTLCNWLNTLTNDKKGISSLSVVSWMRGGYTWFGSCVWADFREIMEQQESDDDVWYKPLKDIRQVFAHNLLVYYDDNGDIAYKDKPLEFGNCKMLDNLKVYELDTETFQVKILD